MVLEAVAYSANKNWSHFKATQEKKGCVSPSSIAL